MSIAPVGLQAPAGFYGTTPATRSYYSKEERAFRAAQEYKKAHEKKQQREQLKRRVKEERKRTKQEDKAKAKAQVDGHTLEPKRGKGRRLIARVKVKLFRRRS
jgi:hypothetical protein